MFKNQGTDILSTSSICSDCRADHAARWPEGYAAYFVGENPLVVGSMLKIGEAQDIYHRFCTMRSASPLPLECHAWIACFDYSDARRFERKLHERFSGAWSHCEWFKCDEDLLSFVGSIATDPEWSGRRVYTLSAYIPHGFKLAAGLNAEAARRDW
jgi:hypothetical protein